MKLIGDFDKIEVEIRKVKDEIKIKYNNEIMKLSKQLEMTQDTKAY